MTPEAIAAMVADANSIDSSAGYTAMSKGRLAAHVLALAAECEWIDAELVAKQFRLAAHQDCAILDRESINRLRKENAKLRAEIDLHDKPTLDAVLDTGCDEPGNDGHAPCSCCRHHQRLARAEAIEAGRGEKR